jgi:hypothetical protein
MLNLGKFVKESPAVKAIKDLPSPIGWWEITSIEGNEGERTENHGVWYGHIAEILFSVRKNADWSYMAKYKPNMPIPAKRPFYTPLRDSLYLCYCDYYFSDDEGVPWHKLSSILNFSNWMKCGDRVKVTEGRYWKTYHLQLVK